MPRKKKDWVQKQGKWSKNAMEQAIYQIRNNKMAKNKAAKLYNIPRSTLIRRLKSNDPVSSASRPPALSTAEESALALYILQMEERGFGLTINDICKLAFSIVEKSGRSHPFNLEKKCAGYDWWTGYLARHPNLSLRKPEGLSAARSSMLNPNVIEKYFKMLGKLLDETGLKDRPQQIFNVDESGLSTVHDPPKIVGKKGKKSMHSKTSGERGENITVVCCINAEGRALPPMVIFKGQRLNQGLVGNAPPNTLFATSKSSFIDSELFLQWFKKLFLPNLPPQRPILLVLDGHASHINLPVLELAKENSIEMVCLPPHTSHWTQPLDRCVFGPMKKAYFKNCESFMRKNPDRQITRYDFCTLFSAAFTEKMSITNITSGFHATGIFPFNAMKIPEEAYGPSKTSVIAHNDQENENDQLQNREIISDQATSPNQSTSHTNTSARNEAPIASTSRESTSSIDSILVLPQVMKTPMSQKRSNRSTQARCLTEMEFLSELRAKEELIEKQRVEKEQRQNQLAEKRAFKENEKKRKAIEKQAQKQTKTPRREGAVSMDNNTARKVSSDSESFCGGCSGYYYDDGSDDEDWWQCTKCTDWYHETCTGKFGSDLIQFVCPKH